MWTSVICAAALGLAPGQGPLNLTNEYLTYGVLGAPRPDTRLLPGEVLFVAFDAENMTVDKEGKILFSQGMEVVDAKDRKKVLFKQEPRDQEARNMLGGTKLPVFFHVNTGLDQPPGEYILIMTITDRGAKPAATKTVERPFTILKPEFGLVRLQLSYLNSETPERYPAPTTTVVGQVIWINFAAVGFQRDTAKNPNIAIQMRILDQTGKPTLPQPTNGEVKDNIPENLRLIPMQFFLALNREGKFTVELTVTDQIAKKESKLSVPITVMPAR